MWHQSEGIMRVVDQNASQVVRDCGYENSSSTQKKYEVEYYSENRIFRRTGVQAYVCLIFMDTNTKPNPDPELKLTKTSRNRTFSGE